MTLKRKVPGFTLVELIMVMVITGAIAAMVSMELRPAFQSYAAVARRANLTHQADTALRRMVAEVRTAVPNSLRLAAPCLEMVPTSAGGRFRIDVDTTSTGTANPSDPLDLNQPDASFDVLTVLDTVPAAGDMVVIGNQNTDDVYTGASRATIQALSTPAANLGWRRITLQSAKQFPLGYEGGRFAVVPAAQQAVTYLCSGAGLDASRTGTGTLFRQSGYGFNAAQSCQARAGQAIVATKVASCNFIYNPSGGATQQSGFVQLQLTLSDNGEAATLTVGAQVENVP